MKNKNKDIIIILFMILILSVSCTKNNETVNISNEPLTIEEKIQDFEYMYDILEDNYAFFWVNERMHNIDWLSNKEEYTKRIKNTNSDEKFMQELNNILRDLNNGHTHIVSLDHFEWYYSAYGSKNSWKGNKPWGKVLNDPIVLNRYKFDTSKKEAIESGEYIANSEAAFKRDVLIPGKVAYLAIKSMNGDRIEEDGKMIREFYEEIKDYEKLIIDIRNNGGGNDYYWQKNVIEPLASETISVDNYIFTRGDYSKTFYKARGIKLKKVKDLDENLVKKMPKEIDKFDNYYISNLNIKPIDPIDFKGKIYLLVNNKVYSSAEGFASFCKTSGFATLVGETTGGDGIGIDPLLFSLPNSGYVVRFASLLGLDGNFNINDEIKTVPDIIIEDPVQMMYIPKADKVIQYIIND